VIGLEQIRTAADSDDTGPDNDETLRVDTDALATVAIELFKSWEAEILLAMLNGGPSASHCSLWCHGFMAGVKAARTEAGA